MTQIVLMLSIIRHDYRITLRLNGRLAGPCAEDFRFLIAPCTSLEVDLSGVTSIDYSGERLLVHLRDLGATFHGVGLFAHRLRRRVLSRAIGSNSSDFDECGADPDVQESQQHDNTVLRPPRQEGEIRSTS